VFVIVLRHLSLCFVAKEYEDILVAIHTLKVYHAERQKKKTEEKKNEEEEDEIIEYQGYPLLLASASFLFVVMSKMIIELV
jgi:hypothetical protein